MKLFERLFGKSPSDEIITSDWITRKEVVEEVTDKRSYSHALYGCFNGTAKVVDVNGTHPAMRLLAGAAEWYAALFPPEKVNFDARDSEKLAQYNFNSGVFGMVLPDGSTCARLLITDRCGHRTHTSHTAYTLIMPESKKARMIRDVIEAYPLVMVDIFREMYPQYDRSAGLVGGKTLIRVDPQFGGFKMISGGLLYKMREKLAGRYDDEELEKTERIEDPVCKQMQQLEKENKSLGARVAALTVELETSREEKVSLANTLKDAASSAEAMKNSARYMSDDKERNEGKISELGLNLTAVKKALEQHRRETSQLLESTAQREQILKAKYDAQLAEKQQIVEKLEMRVGDLEKKSHGETAVHESPESGLMTMLKKLLYESKPKTSEMSSDVQQIYHVVKELLAHAQQGARKETPAYTRPTEQDSRYQESGEHHRRVVEKSGRVVQEDSVYVQDLEQKNKALAAELAGYGTQMADAETRLAASEKALAEQRSALLSTMNPENGALKALTDRLSAAELRAGDAELKAQMADGRYYAVIKGLDGLQKHSEKLQEEQHE